MILHGLWKWCICIGLCFQLDQFLVENMQGAMSEDSLSSSHPISVPVQDPAQINEIFDAISYDKVTVS